MNELVKRKRDIGIDLIKTVAIIGVVMIHTCTTGYSSYEILSFNWTCSVFWGSIVRASVPLFFMCSGALLLSPEKEFSIRRLYKKNMPRIVLAMFAWATFYKAFHLLAAGTLSADACIQAIKEVLLFKHEYHLYFLHIILLIYAFLPITRIFVKNASRRQMQYALILWFCLGIVYPTLKPFWPLTLLGGIPQQWMLNLTYASVGYSVFGYYFTKYKLSVRKSALLAAVGFSAVFGFTVHFSARVDSLDLRYFEGASIGVALLAAGVFNLLYHLKEHITSTRVQTALIKCANASFCIFLVHVFWLDVFRALHIDVTLLPCIVSIPLMVSGIIILSWFSYALLSKIPIVKRWLI